MWVRCASSWHITYWRRCGGRNISAADRRICPYDEHDPSVFSPEPVDQPVTLQLSSSAVFMACGMIWAFVPAAAIRIMMRMMEAVTSGVLMSRRWSTVTVITPIGAPRNMPAATFGVLSSPMQIAMLNSVQSMQVPSANGERLSPPLSVRERYFSTKRSSISVSCKRGVPGGRLTSTAPPEAGMRAVMLRALRRTVTFTSPNVGCVSVRELSIFPSEARCRVNMRLSRNPTEVWCGWC